MLSYQKLQYIADDKGSASVPNGLGGPGFGKSGPGL